MIGSGNDDGVHIAIVQHLAIIGHQLRRSRLGILKGLFTFQTCTFVNIADVLELAIFQAGKTASQMQTAPIGSHHPQSDGFIRRSGSPKQGRSSQRRQSGCGGSSEELAA